MTCGPKCEELPSKSDLHNKALDNWPTSSPTIERKKKEDMLILHLLSSNLYIFLCPKYDLGANFFFLGLCLTIFLFWESGEWICCTLSLTTAYVSTVIHVYMCVWNLYLFNPFPCSFWFNISLKPPMSLNILKYSDDNFYSYSFMILSKQFMNEKKRKKY